MNLRKPAVVLGLVSLVSVIPSPTNSQVSVSYVPPLYGVTIEVKAAPTIAPTFSPVVVIRSEPKIQTPQPSPQIVRKSAPPTYYKTKVGIASTYGTNPAYAGLIALPEGRGIRVEVCGPLRCIIRRSNDAGPALAMQRKGRIIDINLSDFLFIGGSWSMGLIYNVRVKYLK